MAGHSKFKNIMHRKGAQDKKRAKVFTKLIRELTVAAQAGGMDPDANPRLRSAIATAKTQNLPKDTMERAIKRGGSGEDTTNYEQVRYEGYGPAGVAIVVEALTDNRNRTASEVRSAFNKYNGNLGETNSVSFQFDHVGHITYPATVGSADEVLEYAIEAGAEDVESSEDDHDIYCQPEDLHAVAGELSKNLEDPSSAKFTWKPKNLIAVDEKNAETLLKLIDVLEDLDDVQDVYANFDIADEILEKLN
jgi:YebC/PmpR family DNA-binding regulatory protein